MLRYSAIVYFAFATGLHAQTVYVNSRIIAITTSASSPVFYLSTNGFSPPLGPSGPAERCEPCETGISFTYDGARISFGLGTLDGSGSDWFLVEPGDTFSRATIDAGQFPTIIKRLPPPHLGLPYELGEVTVGSGEFYLGVSTGMYGSRTAYGWVHLKPVDGVLTMVENVMSYNSRGIIVGTTTVVPEPSIGILVIGAVASLLTLRLKR